jgi:methionine aminopeptidase
MQTQDSPSKHWCPESVNTVLHVKDGDKIKVNCTRSMDPSTIAVIAIVVGAGSEIISLLPIKANGWIQLIFTALKTLFPKK